GHVHELLLELQTTEPGEEAADAHRAERRVLLRDLLEREDEPIPRRGASGLHARRLLDKAHEAHSRACAEHSARAKRNSATGNAAARTTTDVTIDCSSGRLIWRSPCRMKSTGAVSGL